MAEVEGDLENIDGIIRVTKIRIHYRIDVPREQRDAAMRALSTYADKCPAYVSVAGCIELASSADFQESAT